MCNVGVCMYVSLAVWWCMDSLYPPWSWAYTYVTDTYHPFWLQETKMYVLSRVIAE